ncbi:hypothetical protein UF75_1523 [Desulfosporosinus sp. I2]|nr:hypothetical protein UF75_1523 [Desulfosporosinus sp. I2]
MIRCLTPTYQSWKECWEGNPADDQCKAVKILSEASSVDNLARVFDTYRAFHNGGIQKKIGR